MTNTTAANASDEDHQVPPQQYSLGTTHTLANQTAVRYGMTFFTQSPFVEDDTDTTESGSTEYATDVMFDMKTMNVVPATVCYTYLEPSYT